MDFRDSPEEAAFRDRLRGWLTEQKGKFPTSGDEYWAKAGEWHARCTRPDSSARRGPRRTAARTCRRSTTSSSTRRSRRRARRRGRASGYLVVGLSHHGDEELRQRFLPGMINGTERWCQGFSEPGAGSDLASLTTTATRDGDEYVIHGHKIWTSYSDVADWCLVLARTDKDVPKHKGISAFIVPMHQPGIVQRPLKMISGVTKEFGQVEFDGARVSGREHGRRAGRRLEAGDDRGQPRARTVDAGILGALRKTGAPVDLPGRRRRAGGAVLGVGADRDAAAARAAAAVRAAGRHHARAAGIAGQAADDMGRAVGRARGAGHRRHRATRSCSAPTCTAARRASWAAPRRFRRTSSRSGFGWAR